MNLQELLGESFHENMTYDEVATALSGMKLADLSTGNYVDTNKYNADIQAKDGEISRIKTQLNDKLTDSEKDAAAREADKQMIEDLKNQIKNQTISSNRDKAEALTSDIKNILGIDANDNDYSALLDTLSNIESDSVRTMANYINKLVKDSYDKGKADTTKDNLGKFSKDVKGGSQSKDEVGAFGKSLAEGNKQKVDPNLYFK